MRSPLAARWTAGLSLAVIAAGLAFWLHAGRPGDRPPPDGSPLFCEEYRPGWIKQPANTWSSLAFVAVGVALAFRARAGRSGLMALLIVLLGPGSMVFHATMAPWSGAADAASMQLFVGFAGLRSLARFAPFLDRRFAAVSGVLAACLAVLKAADPWGSNLVFGLLLGVLALAETWSAVREPEGDRMWLAAAVVLFGAAFAVWFLSNTGGPLCSPRSLLQGHAVWHLLCALAAGALFLHFDLVES